MAGLHDISPMVAKLWVTGGVHPHARGRGRGLAAGMATANDDDIEALVHGPHLVASGLNVHCSRKIRTRWGHPF